ncbi:MAG TPA: hypothetical protein VFU59_00045 [Candidatus Eisenbacteria bacterium]|nr:hypothetical protein [Candidatus Eisenbacteria bacterium]
MKRLLLAVLTALLMLPTTDISNVSGAPAPAAPAPKGPKKQVKVTGELLDMGCFISRGLRGDLHRECATKCINNGVPMGLMTADSTVYVLTQNHDRAMDAKSFAGSPDPYTQLKNMASLQVEVMGFNWERNGVKFLEVKFATLKPAAAATPPKPGS